VSKSETAILAPERTNLAAGVKEKNEQEAIGTMLAADALARGAERAGIDACVYLPDSCLLGLIRKFRSAGKLMMVPCAREDEGFAIAMGLQLGGRMPICVMEASGIGYSALILARAQVQRTPVLVIASHNSGPGEPYDYHAATFLVAEGVFRGLGIPYAVASDVDGLDGLLYRIVQTVRGQLTSFGLLIPAHLAIGVS
jgi:sulfopyruvate decarboxylase TPP-binding subunit